MSSVYKLAYTDLNGTVSFGGGGGGGGSSRSRTQNGVTYVPGSRSPNRRNTLDYAQAQGNGWGDTPGYDNSEVDRKVGRAIVKGGGAVASVTGPGRAVQVGGALVATFF